MSALIRKQVRFDTPKKSDPRLRMESCCEYDEPRPFIGQKSTTVTNPSFLEFDIPQTTQLDDFETSNRPIYKPTFDKIVYNRPSFSNDSQNKLIHPTSGLDLSLFDDGKSDDFSYPNIATVVEDSKLKPQSESDVSFFLKPGQTIKRYSPIPRERIVNFEKARQDIPEVKSTSVIDKTHEFKCPTRCLNLEPAKNHLVEKKLVLHQCCPTESVNYCKSRCQCAYQFDQNVCLINKCCGNGSNKQVFATKELTDCCRSEKVKNAETKTLAIDKYLQGKSNSPKEIEVSPQDVSRPVKQKREPTVTDLFKIIKIQNEQLQLLHNKLDKFLLSSDKESSEEQLKIPELTNTGPVEQVSIGCMTSFEMVRTSIYTQHKVKMKTQNVQIHCNKSEISIKEVYGQDSKGKFLEGIPKINENNITNKQSRSSSEESIDDKAVNELSLANLQVDNISRQNSPEPSINVDIQDYSDSENDKQPNVGWTYYNKVMNHVDEILYDDQPSLIRDVMNKSAPKGRVQIDRTDISVTTSKRVTFNEPPFISPVTPTHTVKPSSDLSMQMNRLAMRYLGNQPELNRIESPKSTPNNFTNTGLENNAGYSPCYNQNGFDQVYRSPQNMPETPHIVETPRIPYSHNQPPMMAGNAFRHFEQSEMKWNAPVPIQAGNIMQHNIQNQFLDISAGTRHYMEQNRLLPGAACSVPSKFLDITALKQQPKFL